MISKIVNGCFISFFSFEFIVCFYNNLLLKFYNQEFELFVYLRNVQRSYFYCNDRCLAFERVSFFCDSLFFIVQIQLVIYNFIQCLNALLTHVFVLFHFLFSEYSCLLLLSVGLYNVNECY